MKTKASSPYSQITNTNTNSNKSNHLFRIIGDFEVAIQITANPLQLPLDSLFQMAARINKKRSFLFVSKVLGKHIPVNPYVSLLSGASLALLYQQQRELVHDISLGLTSILNAIQDPQRAKSTYELFKTDPTQLIEPTLFIGFAETATALGHSMFECFKGPAYYLHTTREEICGMDATITFEEEHSHATSHRCYAIHAALFTKAKTIVLVDDEITTGNTSLNIIRVLHNTYQHSTFIVASLLDWRSSANRQSFLDLEKELEITIQCLSLIEGKIEVTGSPDVSSEVVLPFIVDKKVHLMKHSLAHFFESIAVSSTNGLGQSNSTSYLLGTGRFGLSVADHLVLEDNIQLAVKYLQSKRTGIRTLCMGTGEFMYIPMRLAAEMGEGILYQSTTRSPIFPHPSADYAVSHAYPFASPDDPMTLNFMYNIPPGAYDELFLFMERQVDAAALSSLTERLLQLGIPRVHLVFFNASQLALAFTKKIAAPDRMGSYAPEDVIFLLKDLSDVQLERPTEDREEAIQSGVHYSEMLPVEYQPTPDYIQLFHMTLNDSAEKVAHATGVVAEQIVNKRGLNVVLVSLARAGTPIGILIKRYIKQVYNIDLPHYSISIIRGKGIDQNAILYILQNHPNMELQFVDGWTGKGAIRKVLIEACEAIETNYGVILNDDLAVLADPGYCSETFGTREDFLIPSACLNSTVSGLMSRTVLRDDLIGPDDFHGAKFYKEWLSADLSNLFIDKIAPYYPLIEKSAKIVSHQQDSDPSLTKATWKGIQDIQRIQKDFGITDINLVKPGVGETTRVLLRRVPWKILVDRLDNPYLKHILLLSKDRNVTVEAYPDLTYSCCGIIKPMKGGDL
jgi:hypothetical protein